jgi:hypothetical protein
MSKTRHSNAISRGIASCSCMFKKNERIKLVVGGCHVRGTCVKHALQNRRPTNWLQSLFPARVSVVTYFQLPPEVCLGLGQ